ncbi:MAG: putative sugar nucleotidyl transferase [candidate division Zixibacteria bacterium]|nr:putative sugar nucleotidyl transferase [candidate division Zixibacteria bacterium]
MSITICFFEDSKYTQFYPLTYLRPVYTLRAGIVPLFQRATRYFPDAHICLSARDLISPLTAEQNRDFPVNIIKRGDLDEVLFLNGRIRDYGDLPGLIRGSRISCCFKKNGEVVAALFKGESVEKIAKLAIPSDYAAQRKREGNDIVDFDTRATLYNYTWEIMADIEREVTEDFAVLRPSFPTTSQSIKRDGVHILKSDQLYIGEGTIVLPSAVLDASKGPIYIGANCKIESQVAIYGPCAIGPNSVIVAGKIAASSIGHTCRVGGEVEESVFQSYVNKYHAGFIGHSYVGSWVNFGAMTTNSDLKNNYSTIRLTVNGQSVDSGSIKVGSFIGDHTKFGIGTLLNTGINIGVCCNIFGGSLVTDKEIPSFSWGNTGSYQKYEVDKAVETAQRTTERRNQTLTEREKTVLRALAAKTDSNMGVINF